MALAVAADFGVAPATGADLGVAPGTANGFLLGSPYSDKNSSEKDFCPDIATEVRLRAKTCRMNESNKDSHTADSVT